MALKLAIVFILNLLCTTALAAQPDPKALAKEHFERGVEAYNDRRFADAAQEFNLAYQISPAFAVLYNIGQVNAALGNPVEAADAYEMYLSQAGTSIPDSRRKEVISELENQRGRIGTLLLTATPEGADVRIDGKLTGKAPLRDPMRLATGKRVITVLADGYAAQVREVDVTARTQVELDVTLEQIAANTAPVLPVAVPAPATTSASSPQATGNAQAVPLVVTAPRVESDSAGSIQRGLGYAVGGIGIALVASGGVLALVGVSQANTAENRMTAAQGNHDAAAWDTANSDYNSAKSRNQLGLEGIGLGAALLVGGGLLVLTAPSSRSTALTIAPFKTTHTSGMAARLAW